MFHSLWFSTPVCSWCVPPVYLDLSHLFSWVFKPSPALCSLPDCLGNLCVQAFLCCLSVCWNQPLCFFGPKAVSLAWFCVWTIFPESSLKSLIYGNLQNEKAQKDCWEDVRSNLHPLNLIRSSHTFVMTPWSVYWTAVVVSFWGSTSGIFWQYLFEVACRPSWPVDYSCQICVSKGAWGSAARQ